MRPHCLLTQLIRVGCFAVALGCGCTSSAAEAPALPEKSANIGAERAKQLEKEQAAAESTFRTVTVMAPLIFIVLVGWYWGKKRPDSQNSN